MLWSKVAVLTDHHVDALHGDSIISELKEQTECPIHKYVIPAGEESKCRKMKYCVEEWLFQLEFDRNSLLISLGGGVVLDLGGFIAATFLRGIKHFFIPTTLLAMVDASIGGKCGINTSWGKNSLGAFHPPMGSLVRTEFLHTLPVKEMKCGWMEVLKIALLYDYDLFMHIKEEGEIEQCIFRARKLKENVVAKDPCEQGERRALNFGHTVAHALECLSNWTLSHGEALWQGLLIESALSAKCGLLSLKEKELVHRLLFDQRFCLQSSIPWSGEEVFQLMLRDKKNVQKEVRFVLLEKVGQVATFEGTYCTPISREDFLATWKESCEVLYQA